MRKNSWLNGILYSCRKIGNYPAIYVERDIVGKTKGVSISIFSIKGQAGDMVFLPKRLARLLIARLQEAMYEGK